MGKKPRATHQGKLTIGDKTIDCAVLEDGTRLITQTSFLRALERSIRPVAGSGASFEKIPAFLAPKNLKPFISEDLEHSMKPIIFKPIAGGYKGKAFGYMAETLPMVCGVYIDAENNGKLLSTQKHMAEAAKILIRGLATVGIIALVDEATGYQEVRARKALEEILEKFITKELRKWAKTFPDDFYKEMFRLRDWQYIPFSVKRPAFVGRLTNDIVYERLAPAVLDELKRINPTDDRGRRKHRHHQWLTEDVGHPRLREHLSAVIALMKASSTWGQFKRALTRALPKYGDQLSLDLDNHKD